MASCNLDLGETDARGVRRGRCKSCSCDGYSTASGDLKCVKCKHPPGKHENLSTATTSQSSISQPSVPKSSGSNAVHPLMLSPKTSQARADNGLPQASFQLGPQCQVSQCTKEAFFDLNTSKQYPLCQGHLQCLSDGFHNMYICKPTDDQDGSEMFAVTQQPPTSTPVSLDSIGGFLSPRQPPPTISPMMVMPTSAKVRRLNPKPTQAASLPPFMLGSKSTPNFALPPPQSQTLVPSCKFPGCTRPKFKEPDTGREHDFCGKTHYLQYMRQQEQGLVVAQERQCKTPGCYRQQRIRDDGEGYYDYCSLTCRDKGQMQMSASMPSLLQTDNNTCIFPDCNRPKYIDPGNRRVHDFCSRRHAYEAQRKGITVDTVSIMVVSSQESTTVTAKFTSAWATAKGTCPQVCLVFAIKNTKLEQRWKAYQQTLKDLTVEEHYHGTVLTCDVTSQKRLCNDKDCGICGIAKAGLDRRCIQKNISFQRFGHGFYLAPNSSKCHDYTQGANNYRAMLLCDVVPGNKYLLSKNDQSLKGPPQGFDCIYGKAGPTSCLNYDEIVVHNPDSVMPRYVVVYQRDGVNKIAT